MTTQNEDLKRNLMWSMMQEIIGETIKNRTWIAAYGFYLIQQFEKCYPYFRKTNPGWLERKEEELIKLQKKQNEEIEQEYGKDTSIYSSMKNLSYVIELDEDNKEV